MRKLLVVALLGLVTGCSSGVPVVHVGMKPSEVDAACSSAFPPALPVYLKVRPDGGMRRVFAQRSFTGSATTFICVDDNGHRVVQVQYEGVVGR